MSPHTARSLIKLLTYFEARCPHMARLSSNTISDFGNFARPANEWQPKAGTPPSSLRPPYSSLRACSQIAQGDAASCIISLAVSSSLTKLRLCRLNSCARVWPSSMNSRVTMVQPLSCVATQPALIERLEKPERSFVGGFRNVREIAPAPSRLYRSLRRVTIHNAGPLTDAQVAQGMLTHRHALVIVNTRRHAHALYNTLGDNEGVAHLSTLMCPEHRRRRLRAIRQRLIEDRPVRLVSTSLIEAGVDVDFGAVWRAMAGLDQIAQAAGRCNREGRQPASRSIVTIFEPEHPQPRYVRAPADAARDVMRHHQDPLSLAALEAYFQRLYWARQLGRDGLDVPRILRRLNAGVSDLLFPHEEVARDMHLIDDVEEAILIPFDDTARRLIVALRTAENLGPIARMLQPYTVGVYPGDFQALVTAGVIVPATDDQQFWTLAQPDYYRDDLGLIIQGKP